MSHEPHAFTLKVHGDKQFQDVLLLFGPQDVGSATFPGLSLALNSWPAAGAGICCDPDTVRCTPVTLQKTNMESERGALYGLLCTLKRPFCSGSILIFQSVGRGCVGTCAELPRFLRPTGSYQKSTPPCSP